MPPEIVSGSDVRFLVNPAEENDCTESIQLQTLPLNAAALVLGIQPDDDEDNDSVSLLESVSVSERLRSVLIVRHMLELEDGVDAVARDALLRLHRVLRCTQSATATQTRIPQYFQ